MNESLRVGDTDNHDVDVNRLTFGTNQDIVSLFTKPEHLKYHCDNCVCPEERLNVQQKTSSV